MDFSLSNERGQGESICLPATEHCERSVVASSIGLLSWYLFNFCIVHQVRSFLRMFERGDTGFYIFQSRKYTIIHFGYRAFFRFRQVYRGKIQKKDLHRSKTVSRTKEDFAM
jgi:hypothetical protein